MTWLQSQKDVPWVWLPDFDVRSMVHDGLSYLLKRGFRKITFVSQCVAGDGNGDVPGMEYQGVWNAFAEKGLPVPSDMIKYWGATIQDGYKGMKKLMSDRKSRSDAIYINHDTLTKGALRGLDEMGLNIPDDIALLTHANKGDEFESRTPLTKMEIDPYEIALTTMHYVETKFLYAQGQIDTLRLQVPDMIKPKLVVGKSCGEK
jgi:DNA-binding LacI/PurR family transcriptional regulator